MGVNIQRPRFLTHISMGLCPGSGPRSELRRTPTIGDIVDVDTGSGAPKPRMDDDRQASKVIVELLALAHERACEAELAALIGTDLDA